MNKKISTTLFLLLMLNASVGAILSTDFISNKQTNPSLGECSHEHVEHYASAATPNSPVSVEHWACCDCHKAWANQEKTLLLSSNTREDRRFLSENLGMSFITNDNIENTKLIYNSNDVEGAFLFQCNTFKSKIATIKTTGTNFQLQHNESIGYTGVIGNDSPYDTEVTMFTIGKSKEISKFRLGKKETRDFYVTIDDFNYESSNGDYGFLIEVNYWYDASPQTPSYITLTNPQYESKMNQFFDTISGGYSTIEYSHPQYDKLHGPIYTRSLGSRQYYFNGRKIIDESKYSAVSFEVYNTSKTTVGAGSFYSSDMYPSKGVEHPRFRAQEWTSVVIPVGAWNGGGTIGAYCEMIYLDQPEDCVLKFANFNFIEKEDDTYLWGPSWEANIRVLTYTELDDVHAGRILTDHGIAFEINWDNGIRFEIAGRNHIDEGQLLECYFYNDLDKEVQITGWSFGGKEFSPYGKFPQKSWKVVSILATEFNKGDYNFVIEQPAQGRILVTYMTKFFK